MNCQGEVEPERVDLLNSYFCSKCAHKFGAHKRSQSKFNQQFLDFGDVLRTAKPVEKPARLDVVILDD